jgi:16S rRNA (cytosine1402-N4)-methyltransferase
MSRKVHIPVLLGEVTEALNISPGKRYVDCTLGLGGHALSILEQGLTTVQLLGIDADLEAINIAKNKLSPFSRTVLLVNDNFGNLECICRENDFLPVDGILFDLGISSLQIDSAERGFSFRHDAHLDMRFNPTQILTATDLVNILPENKLAELLSKYGEEHQSKKIARNIVEHRPVVSTIELAHIIERTVGTRKHKIHPATKTFLALRIVVNHELENLETALNQTINCLDRRGRLVVISYNSLEDRIVKQFIKREITGCICPSRTPICNCGHIPSLKLISKKVIVPTPEEIAKNPRSRSAKLRVAERL